MNDKFKELDQAVQALIQAEIDDQLKGAGDPADIPEIEERLAEARSQYLHALTALQASPRPTTPQSHPWRRK